jgi:hypothetical protein
MPTYHDIIAGTALRIDALIGTQAAALQTTYETRPLTTANFQSTIIPFAGIKNGVQYAESKLVDAIAETGDHPWQANIRSLTATITSGSLIPSTDASSVKIVGIYGAVRDTATGNVCFEKPLATIQRRVTNSNSFWVVPVYYYRMDGTRIYHTTDGVKIDVCVYDTDAQATAIDDDDEILLPGTLEEAYVCGALSYCLRDDEFSAQASIFRQYFEGTIAGIRGGLTSVSAKSAPSPIAA